MGTEGALCSYAVPGKGGRSAWAVRTFLGVTDAVGGPGRAHDLGLNNPDGGSVQSDEC